MIVRPSLQCRMQLIVAGDRPERIKLRQSDPNVQLVAINPATNLRESTHNVCGHWLSCLSSQACGTPVLAFGRGGHEAVVDDQTDVFEEQTALRLRAVNV